MLSRIPTYDEIVNKKEEEDDDEEFEEAEEFERKFNFRYQEPDAEFVCLIARPSLHYRLSSSSSS